MICLSICLRECVGGGTVVLVERFDGGRTLSSWLAYLRIAVIEVLGGGVTETYYVKCVDGACGDDAVGGRTFVVS